MLPDDVFIDLNSSLKTVSALMFCNFLCHSALIYYQIALVHAQLNLKVLI